MVFRRKGALAVLATTVAVSTTSTVLTGTAQAEIIQQTSFHLDGDEHFYFGKGNGEVGQLKWFLNTSQISIFLSGALHLDGVVGNCARMRIDYLDINDNTLATKFGGTVCADDNTDNWWEVNLDPGYASTFIDKVKVSIEKQTVQDGAFKIADSYLRTVHIDGDYLKITAKGFDFGSNDLAFGEPMRSGFVIWEWEDGQLTPRLVGTLHLNNIEGGCARMNIRYLTSAGVFLTSKSGGIVCASDNGHHKFTVDLAPYESNKIGEINVQLQSQNTNGTFTVVGSSRASVAYEEGEPY